MSKEAKDFVLEPLELSVEFTFLVDAPAPLEDSDAYARYFEGQIDEAFKETRADFKNMILEAAKKYERGDYKRTKDNRVHLSVKKRIDR